MDKLNKKIQFFVPINSYIKRAHGFNILDGSWVCFLDPKSYSTSVTLLFTVIIAELMWI